MSRIGISKQGLVMDHCIVRDGVATWIRRATASVITIVALAACGGGGGGGSSGNITPDGPSGPSKIFLADSQKQVVFSSVNPNPPAGVLALSRTISGAGVSANMPDVAYDSGNNELYIVNGSSIAVINSGSTANGNAPVVRTITSPAIAGFITSIYLDTAHNELYVVDAASNIFLFSNVSGASGSVSPFHTITISRAASTVVVTDIFVDTSNDILYAELRVTGAASGVVKAIALFTGARTLNAPATVSSEITFTSAADALEITGDGNADMLFVVNSALSTVMVFDSISNTLGSNPAVPSRSIATPTFLQKIAFVPSTDRLYGISADQKKLYIVNGASSVSPDPVTVLTNANVGTLTALDVGP